jgi:hypothetical protein
MSVLSLMERLGREVEANRPINWRQLRDEIHMEHEAATTTTDRVALLGLYKSHMDWVERSGDVTDIEGFRKARRQDTALLLVREAMIGATDGQVNPDKMLEITAREVAAGRMSRDDELHKLALGGLDQFDSRGQRRKPGIFSKVRSFFS